MPPHKCIITIIIVEFVCQSNKSLASLEDFFLSFFSFSGNVWQAIAAWEFANFIFVFSQNVFFFCVN